MFRRESRELLYGRGVGRSHSLGGLGGAREQPVLKTYTLTKTKKNRKNDTVPTNVRKGIYIMTGIIKCCLSVCLYHGLGNQSDSAPSRGMGREAARHNQRDTASLVAPSPGRRVLSIAPIPRPVTTDGNVRAV